MDKEWRSQSTTEISSYISRLLRDHFGKGPEAVYASIAERDITIYIRNFLSPTERVLMEQDQMYTILMTRDLVMRTLIPEIKAMIKWITSMEVLEFYYDWGFHNHSGGFVMICSSSQDSEGGEFLVHDYKGKQALEKEIMSISKKVEKEPAETVSYQLNPRTLLVIRNGILVMIEKQLIRLGVRDQLKQAKSQLEKGFLHNNATFEAILESKIIDIFVDWDFDADKSVILFILDPSTNTKRLSP